MNLRLFPRKSRAISEPPCDHAVVRRLNLRLFPRKYRATLRNGFRWKPVSQTRAHLSYSRPRPTALRVHSSCYALARTRTRVHVTRTRTRGWGGRSPAAAAHDRTGRCQHVCARSDVPGSSRRAHLEEEVAAREQQPARRREHATRAPGRQRMRGFSSGRSSARRRRPRRDCCRPAARVEVLDAHAERAARARARGARRHDKRQSR